MGNDIPERISSMLVLARSSVRAGHEARAARLKVTKRTPEKRKETVLSGTKKDEDPMAADRWMYVLGRDRRDWQDEALGAGTPFTLLYLLGWVMGKHWCGQCTALVPIIFIWAKAFIFALQDRFADFAEIGIPIIATIVLSAGCFFGHVTKRTPKGIPRSADFWVALVLEVILANTLTCITHGLGGLAMKSAGLATKSVGSETKKGWVSIEEMAILAVRAAASTSAFGTWYALHNVVLDRQCDFIEKNNLAAKSRIALKPYQRRLSLHGECSPAVLRELVRTVVLHSRDLRMTGLSRSELQKVAYYIKGDEADLIYHYTRGGESRKAFELLHAFHRGYEENLHNDSSSKVGVWVKLWLSTAGGSGDALAVADPLAAIWQLCAREEPPACEGEIEEFCPNSGAEAQIWWLCGAIARACDSCAALSGSSLGQNGHEVIEIDRFQWYALTASALSVNRNPLAVILAMATERKGAATAMLEKLEIGCEQVLRQASAESDSDFYRKRGLVVTTAGMPRPDAESIPIITYSAAGAWQAELRRETVMLGKDAFNSLWLALIVKNDGLLSYAKQDLRRNSVEWSKKVVIHVDYTGTLAFLGLQGSALARVPVSAKQGWLMHLLWVLVVIVMRRYLPRQLLNMALFSTAFMQFGKADQYAHIVYVGFHLWRSPIGQICRIFPLVLSDADVDNLGYCGVVLAVFVVNYGSAYMGMMYETPFEQAAFWFLLLGSIAPGCWYLFLCGRNTVDSGATVVRYRGRMRGKGYEHREESDGFRPLGRDAQKPDDDTVAR